ncbi:protein GRINL1A [Heteronotia binoei]|uniref:protein GRINL1A n=1 Tax=Heteronotia binoei TaxID=13085 RepID=UPI00292D59C6|nr:protein GRINL1A [Heteronotia binoei]
MAEPEPLRGKSLPELREILRRQERLLSDRKFISRLPDKGKKISASVEKLKVAITEKEEERRRTELLSTARLTFQKRQEELDSSQCRIAASEDSSAREDSPQTPASHVNEELGSAVQKQPKIWATKAKEPAQQVCGDADTHQGKGSVSKALAPSGKSSDSLVEALEKISLRKREDQNASRKQPDAECRENPSQGLPQQTPKMPHCIAVLERRARSPVRKRNAFRPNRILAEVSGSSCSSSEAPSPGGGHSPISAEERLRREKQHLDDITAARLPILHHAPAQLLPLEESIALQVQQKAAYEEMQARFAAQKLAQKLSIKMVAYEPEGEAGVSYREAKDEDGYSSAED